MPDEKITEVNNEIILCLKCKTDITNTEKYFDPVSQRCICEKCFEGEKVNKFIDSKILHKITIDDLMHIKNDVLERVDRFLDLLEKYVKSYKDWGCHH